MLKKLKFLVVLLMLLSFCCGEKFVCFADFGEPPESEIKVYAVFDELDNLIFTQENVQIGDQFIDQNFNVYEVYFIDEENLVGYAEIVKKLEMPDVTKTRTNKIASPNLSKKIGLYITHNDESYITGDGKSSIYGAGGIHDIARELKNQLRKKGIEVILDETLHIPHDGYAYSRSKPTAQNLLKQEPDALFDIHRDGASRSTYVKKDKNGKDYSRVRIVIGQANPNKEQNLQFALYMLSVAKKIEPDLFVDIFYAKNHYNQALSSKMLLFEMGAHTVEKDLVLKSTEKLANVIYSTLYLTTVDEEGNLNITSNETDAESSIKNVLQLNDELNAKSFPTGITVFLGILTSVVVITIIILIKKKKMPKI